MKRVLTGIAAAGVVLGMTVPTAFAATNSSMNMKAMTWKQDQIMLGTSSIGFKGFEAMYAGTETTYMPIYYLNEYLHKMGFGASWDGVNKVWSITTPTGVTVDTSAFGTAGQGTAGIYVNGTLVQMTTPKFAKDPASHVETTYMPIYFLLKVLQGIGVAQQSDWNGTTGMLTLVKPTVTTPSSSVASLSAITATGQTTGTGTESNPAVALNSGSITLSTTLMDAMGNPVPNTAVTFNVSEYGNLPSSTPTVMSGTNVVSATQTSNADQYTVYTNSNGVATATLTGPSGVTYAYEVTASAPYLASNGMSVTSSPYYTEFVANNEAGISPLAAESTPFGATLGTAVPVTVAVPPNASGQAQADVLVTLTLNSATTGSANGAYFTDAEGADLGTTIDVATNSAGIATAMVNDSTAQTVSVTTMLPTTLGVTNPPVTYLQFAQAGIPTQVANMAVSNSNPQQGQNVVISGTLEDAAGNPVPNGQVLVAGFGGYSSSATASSGDFAYVTGSGSSATTTDFPSVGPLTNVTTGIPASSAYGEVVTANSSGNFSFTVTDPDSEVDQYAVFPVVNGSVSGSALTTGTLDFTSSNTLSVLSIAGSEGELGNDDTSLTGLSSSISGTTQLWLQPQNSANTALTDQSFTYQLSATNGGQISSIDGTSLTIPAAAETVTVNYGMIPGSSSSAMGYYITVPGQTTSNTDNYITVPSGDGANLEVGLSTPDTGTTNFTATSGTVKATASVSVTSGAPYDVANFPAELALNPGQFTTVTYEVEDASGNPVPNSVTSLAFNNTPTTTAAGTSTGGLWITQVNGVSLTGSVNVGTTSSPSYATEPTPIPLYMKSVPVAYNVSMPGAVSWNTGSNVVNVYTNSKGMVTLTLQAGDVAYWSGTGTTVNTSNSGSGLTTNFYTYDGSASSTPYQVYVTPSASTTGWGSSASQVGTISW